MWQKVKRQKERKFFTSCTQVINPIGPFRDVLSCVCMCVSVSVPADMHRHIQFIDIN